MEWHKKLAELTGLSVDKVTHIDEDVANSLVGNIEAAKSAAQAVTISPSLEQDLRNAKDQANEDAEAIQCQLVTNSDGTVSLSGRPAESMFIVNSYSNGKFKNERIDGKEHLIVSVMAIEANTVMNEMHYGMDAVENSFEQFNDELPVPVRHPLINGVPVSASSSRAQNQNGIGAFTRKSVMRGAKVFNEIAIPLEKALSSELGTSIVRHIKSGNRLGVSTAGHANIINESGVATGDGRRYSKNVVEIKWDHLALLPNEEAAGAHVGTQVINAGSSELVYVCNVDETQLEDTESMTDQEQVANLKERGFTVLAPDAPELKKLEISNEDLEAVEKMRADETELLNTKRTELAELWESKPEELNGMSLDLLNTAIEKAKDTKGGNFGVRNQADGKPEGDGKKVTAGDVREVIENCDKEEESK